MSAPTAARSPIEQEVASLRPLLVQAASRQLDRLKQQRDAHQREVDTLRSTHQQELDAQRNAHLREMEACIDACKTQLQRQVEQGDERKRLSEAKAEAEGAKYTDLLERYVKLENEHNNVLQQIYAFQRGEGGLEDVVTTMLALPRAPHEEY